MNNKEFSKILEERTKGFAIMIIRLSASLPDTIEYRVIRYQITKSGTSVGANYRESNRSRSKADFINRIRICESECSETIFWLEVILDMGDIRKHTCLSTLKEATELLAIFTSASGNLR
jgi:four helix bundle protein